MDNKFYDVHFHAMDLSHANITAFINRYFYDDNALISADSIKNLLRKYLPKYKLLGLLFYPYSLFSKKIHRVIKDYFRSDEFLTKTSKARNLLSFMESSILYDFLIIEFFLKKDGMIGPDNMLKIGENRYNKIVICPLVVDFGYKNIYDPHIFYNIPPQKPITSQIRDLFESIKIYYNNELNIKYENDRTKFEVIKVEVDKKDKLFEIYPFMGINTQNYSFEDIEKMLNKYFSEFSANDTADKRQAMLYQKMGEFKGNLDDDADCRNIFVGIKVYPPLGFEPWPEKLSELKKVELLYQTCIDRNIPIISHCSTGGFIVDRNAREFTNPGYQWNKVLEKYPNLKIDFAHFGSGNPEWKQAIINHIIRPNNRVYTDFSCSINGDEDYQEIKDTIIKLKDSEKLKNRILFGTDFMINLLWLKSYNEYLKYYIDTAYLDDQTKFRFSNTNPEQFLFG